MRLWCISSSIKQLRLDGFVVKCGQSLAFQEFVVKIYQFLQPLPFAQAFSTLFPVFWCAQAKSKASHPRIFRGLLLLSQLHSPAVLWTVIFRTPRAIAVESPGLLQDSPPKVWWLQQEVLIDVWNADLVASHNGSQRHDTQLTVLFRTNDCIGSAAVICTCHMMKKSSWTCKGAWTTNLQHGEKF